MSENDVDRARQAERRLAAQHAIARLLLSAHRLDEVADALLAEVGSCLGWDLGALWLLDRDRGLLRVFARWQTGEGDNEGFWQATDEIEFAPGIGLPGRAWSSGRLTWSVDLASDENFPRRPAAAAAGLEAGIAVPAPAGDPGEVLAVMEFFTRNYSQPDDQLTRLLIGFGDQLASFIARCEAEATVRDSEALKASVLESALDCIVTMDRRGRVVDFNPAAVRTFGYTRREAVGSELAELVIPAELRDRHREGLARYLRSRRSRIIDQRVELTAVRKDGSRFPVELTVTELGGSAEALFAGFVRDISDRRHAEETRRQLAAIVESSADAIFSIDVAGTISSWNPGAERIYGFREAEVVGRPLSVLLPAERRDEQQLLIEAARGRRAIEKLQTERLRADGRRIDVELTVSPLRDPLRGVTGAAITSRDVTAARRQEKAREFLAAASAALDASLDPEATMRRIVETAIPELAELCVIDLVRDDGTVGDSVVAAVEPGDARELEAIRRRWPLRADGDHPVAEVVRSARSMVLRDLKQPDVLERVRQSDAHGRFIAKASYNSAAVVPMIARGRTLGALSFLHVRNDLRYDPGDLGLLEDLARRAAMALDNARLFDRQSQIAEDLQRDLAPDRLPQVPGVELAAGYEPAGGDVEIGGDFYDVFPGDGRWFVLVGDVAGKGSEAAGITGTIRAAVRALALELRSPAQILERVNRLLLQRRVDQRFATAILAALEPGAHTLQLRICAAGHPPAVVVGESASTLIGRGSLLGVLERPELVDEEAVLGAEEMLVLYTDGLLEAGPIQHHWTSEQLQAQLRGAHDRAPGAVVDWLRSEALARSGEHRRDDLVVVAARPRPASAT